MDGNFEFSAVGHGRAGGRVAVRGRALHGWRSRRARRLPPDRTARSGSVRTPGPASRFVQWATVVPAAGWQLYAGRFTGGDGDDIVVYHPSNGVAEVGRNTGGGVRVRGVGDRGAGGRMDVHGRSLPQRTDGRHRRLPPDERHACGSGTNTGAGFDVRAVGDGVAAVGVDDRRRRRHGQRAHRRRRLPPEQRVAVGRSQHRRRLRVRAVVHVLAGRPTGRSCPATSSAAGRPTSSPTTRATAACGCSPTAATASIPQRWATVAPATGWTFLPGRFTDDELTDVVGYHAGAAAGCGSAASAALGIEGYCWPLSAAPGEQIDFHLSSEGTVDVVYARHVADATGVRSVPVGTATSARRACSRRPPRRLARRVRVGAVDHAHDPRRMAVGDLLGALREQPRRNRRTCTFVVKPRARRAVPTSPCWPTSTRGWPTTVGVATRSTPGGRPSASCGRAPASSPVGVGFEALHLTRAELWILGWLTGEGYRPDVYSDIDFHNGIDLSHVPLPRDRHAPGVLDDRRCTTGSQAYLDGGGSLLYLGGNGIFENGEYIDDQTQMVFWAGVDRTGTADRRHVPAAVATAPGTGPARRHDRALRRRRIALRGHRTRPPDVPLDRPDGGNEVRRRRAQHGRRQRQGHRRGRSTPSTGPARRPCPWTARWTTRRHRTPRCPTGCRSSPGRARGAGGRSAEMIVLPPSRRRARAVGRVAHVRRAACPSTRRSSRSCATRSPMPASCSDAEIGSEVARCRRTHGPEASGAGGAGGAVDPSRIRGSGAGRAGREAVESIEVARR